MINFFSSWSRQIILAVLITIILEMILSKKNKNTKYVRTIIGIYIIYVIVSPWFNLFNKGKFDFENINYEKYDFNENTYSYAKENVENIQNTNLNIAYELKLKQNIEEKLREKGYIVSNIKIKLNTNYVSEEYGQIENLEIKLSKIPDDEIIKNSNSKLIKIEKVNIKNSNNNQEKIDNMDELKLLLEEEYGLNSNNIIIK